MTQAFTGGCHCAAVRYVGAGKPELSFYCHCIDCQRESGGPFSVEIYLPKSAVNVEGELSEYVVVADNGNRVIRKFCTVCGCPIVLVSDGYPEHICLKAGSLDDASWLSPEMHIFTSTKQPWVHISDDLPQYEGDLEE
jgi:hypothetical protein